jgi:hypothetical protein
MLNFKEWLLAEHGSSTGTRAKIGLYPPLYTQVFNYCPQDVITWGADAITYMSEKDVNHKKPYSYEGKFIPYYWLDDSDDAEEMVQKDPNKIPKSLLD